MVAIYLLGGAALYLSFARTAWVVLLLVVLLTVWSRSRPALRVTLLPPVAGAGVLLALASGRFDDLASLSFFLDHYDFSASTYDFRYVDNSLSWRIANWAMGLRLALEQPLTGHGPGQAIVVSAFGLQMHNLFLEALVELGAPGLIAVVLVVTGLGRMRRHVPQSDPNARGIRALLGALGLGFLLTITLSTSLVGQTMTVMLLLMVLALSIAPIGPAEGSPDAG
ncbi:O-antigen ligase family protein [Phaeovulum sp. NW3]|nr:O-antigen ligase family protein [Phaeovulum sp. NW3]